MSSIFLFEQPIKAVKVNKQVTAYKFLNGMIKIEEDRFLGYSMKEAIRLYRFKQKTGTTAIRPFDKRIN